MKKITTKNLFSKEEKVVAPSQVTLDFLKSFARSYHSENKLPKTLNSMCVN